MPDFFGLQTISSFTCKAIVITIGHIFYLVCYLFSKVGTFFPHFVPQYKTHLYIEPHSSCQHLSSNKIWKNKILDLFCLGKCHIMRPSSQILLIADENEETLCAETFFLCISEHNTIL